MKNSSLNKLQIILTDAPYIRKCPNTLGFLILDNKLKEVIKIAHKIDKPKHKNKKKYKPKKNIEKVCHNCSSLMENIEYMYSSGIFIDRCPSCESVWLDQGYLIQIQQFINNMDKYNDKIHKLTPLMIEIQQDVNDTFRQISEDSNPYKKN